jgi:hypothetical protein
VDLLISQQRLWPLELLGAIWGHLGSKNAPKSQQWSTGKIRHMIDYIAYYYLPVLVAVAKTKTLNQRVPGSSPGAPTKFPQ